MEGQAIGRLQQHGELTPARTSTNEIPLSSGYGTQKRPAARQELMSCTIIKLNHNKTKPVMNFFNRNCY
jgi:hypothetical protein